MNFSQSFNSLAATLAATAYYNSCRRDCATINRSGLLPPSASAWTKLSTDGDDESFTSITSMDRGVFLRLHDVVFPAGERVAKAGRPSGLDTYGKLGMFLVYAGSTIQLKHICMIFGTTMSVTSRIIRKTCHRICSRLKHCVSLYLLLLDILV
jgi:hypothetical protein